ncbi:hypothetical protein [Tsukamurella sp. PLM1]|uniref:hypothetical protein n=1 Tax=Tsukamurella sp. PLM1 TaxID=2929795 RepID=UPI002063A574|nr:hypothetical protein [Tsukamurella sp. PLM1]BDH55551.1 hypothetical protein MTP03_04900 [Tsukamurella sp. PLM1]
MNAHQGLLVDDIFWGMHVDMRSYVAGMWLLALDGTVELTSTADGTIALATDVLGEQYTDKVVVNGVWVLSQDVDSSTTDEPPIPLACRADANDIESANGDEVQAIASNSSPLLDVLDAFVAAGLRTTWSIDRETGRRTSLLAVTAHRGHKHCGARTPPRAGSSTTRRHGSKSVEFAIS